MRPAARAARADGRVAARARDARLWSRLSGRSDDRRKRCRASAARPGARRAIARLGLDGGGVPAGGFLRIRALLEPAPTGDAIKLLLPLEIGRDLGELQLVRDHVPGAPELVVQADDLPHLAGIVLVELV